LNRIIQFGESLTGDFLLLLGENPNSWAKHGQKLESEAGVPLFTQLKTNSTFMEQGE